MRKYWVKILIKVPECGSVSMAWVFMFVTHRVHWVSVVRWLVRWQTLECYVNCPIDGLARFPQSAMEREWESKAILFCSEIKKNSKWSGLCRALLPRDSHYLNCISQNYYGSRASIVRCGWMRPTRLSNLMRVDDANCTWLFPLSWCQ